MHFQISTGWGDFIRVMFPSTTEHSQPSGVVGESAKTHHNQAFGVKNLKHELEMIAAVQGSREEVNEEPRFHSTVCGSPR